MGQWYVQGGEKMKLAQYEVVCETCGKVLTDWVQTVPVECPHDASHIIAGATVEHVADGRMVLKYIMGSCGSTEQLLRFLKALNAHASFPYLINVGQYDLAEAQLDEAITEGHITEDDKAMAMQFIG
jgi:hypothetical protein